MYEIPWTFSNEIAMISSLFSIWNYFDDVRFFVFMQPLKPTCISLFKCVTLKSLTSQANFRYQASISYVKMYQLEYMIFYSHF